MDNRFLTSGTVEICSSKRSLKIQMVNRNGKDYVSIRNVEDLIAGRKKTATVWMPNPNPYKPRIYEIEKRREGFVLRW